MKTVKATLLKEKDIARKLVRLAHEIIENNTDLSNIAIVGIRTRGEILAHRVVEHIQEISCETISQGTIDVTFYRDDFRRNNKQLIPNEVNIDFNIENKHIILVDDVLYTGRSIRAALDAINAYGRPKSVELVALINRKYNREVPIQPDYTGEDIDTRANDYVKVDWKDDQCRVWIITDKTE